MNIQPQRYLEPSNCVFIDMTRGQRRNVNGTEKQEENSIICDGSGNRSRPHNQTARDLNHRPSFISLHHIDRWSKGKFPCEKTALKHLQVLTFSNPYTRNM